MIKKLFFVLSVLVSSHMAYGAASGAHLLEKASNNGEGIVGETDELKKLGAILLVEFEELLPTMQPAQCEKIARLAAEQLLNKHQHATDIKKEDMLRALLTEQSKEIKNIQKQGKDELEAQKTMYEAQRMKNKEYLCNIMCCWRSDYPL